MNIPTFYDIDHLEARNLFSSIKSTEGRILTLSKLSFSEIVEKLRIERRKRFQPKLEKYLNERNSITHQLLIEHDLQFNDTNGSIGTIRDLERIRLLKRKANILDRLVRILTLAMEDCNIGELELHKLEWEYLTGQKEPLQFHNFSFLHTEFADYSIESLKEKLRLLQRNLAVVLRRILRKLKLDIRQRYRSIVHFLFKNMDDEPGDGNSLFSTCKQLLLNLKNSFHGKKRNYFWFAISQTM